MKTTKLLTVSAVAAALVPLASFAAIDDQGMQYVTAAEGLHGSLRVNVLKYEDKNSSDETTGGGKESLRLWITGSGDIGNDWATTYYWEVRDGSGGAKDGTIGTEAWDVGVKSPYGSFSFGRLGMVAPRMVPGGSLDTVAGPTAEHFASDPNDNGWRFESAVFNGFQLGVSGVVNGNDILIGTENDLFDEYSFAVKYSSPRGLQVGVGYEVDVLHDERYDDAAAIDYVKANYDDKSGWRVGVRYGQDNWLLGYEYRNYKGFPGWDGGNLFGQENRHGVVEWVNSAGAQLLASAATAVITTTNLRPFAVFESHRIPIGGVTVSVAADFNKNVGYQVHRLGVQFKLDRITTSAGYSIETQSFDFIPGTTDIDRTAFAFDVAYHLGLNSLIAVGWKEVDTERWAGVTIGNDLNRDYTNAINLSAVTESPSTTTSQLYYRVDF